MAKLSSNGCRKIGAVTTKFRTGRHVFALRSDGKVLTRIAGFYNDAGEYTAHATGYRIFGSLKKAEGCTSYTALDVDRLAEILGKRNHEIMEVK